MGIIQASIPFFFVLLAAEVVWSQRSGTRALRLNDSLSDLSCGILSQLAGIFSKFLTLGIFVWVGERFALQHWLTGIPRWPDRSPFTASDNILGVSVDTPVLFAWSAAFVLVDFCYYWMHRLSHEVHLLWAGHVVHHSSEEYNLAVALRQSSLHGLMSWVFYVPLALLGLPWTVFFSCYALNLVYQFWIHTRAIGVLPRWMEYMLNTPSHHRVHHGINPEYQDRNYGGVFIVFDRWFGTFEPEVAPPVYGITKPLNSWNPVWANVHVYVQIVRDALRAPTWREALHIVFGAPGDQRAHRHDSHALALHRTVGGVDRFNRQMSEKYDPPVPGVLKGYALSQFVLALIAALVVLQQAAARPLGQTFAATFLIAVSLVGVGGIFERAKWARPLESARLITAAAVCVALAVSGSLSVMLAVVALAAAAISLGVVWYYRHLFTEVELAPLM